MNKNTIQGCLPIDNSISFDNYCHIDLSKNNKELQTFDVTSSKKWENYINFYLKKNKAKVAYGGYLEQRSLYDRSNHFASTLKNDKRNIHLGIDFWCKVGTKICAFFDGKIHSFKNNTNYGDYGPTIILEHNFADEKFYSLYGHLSIKSIDKITNQVIKKGEVIGELGSANENGDYAPHLHFQIIKNLEENFGDYPGVCSYNTLNFYKQNCPNPLSYIKKMPTQARG